MTRFEKRQPTETRPRSSSQLGAPPSPDLLSWASRAMLFKLSAFLEAHCPLDLSSGASADAATSGNGLIWSDDSAAPATVRSPILPCLRSFCGGDSLQSPS